MKKIYLLGLISLLLITGCSSNSTEGASSLKEAYFEIAEKVDNEDKISKKYIKKLMSKSEYEKGKDEEIEHGPSGEKIKYYTHIFKNEKESLQIQYCETTDAINMLSYEGSKNNEKEYLMYVGKDKISAAVPGEEKKAMMSSAIHTPDIKKQEKIYKQINKNISKLESTYYEIATNMDKENNISIEEIEKSIGSKALEVIDEKVENEKGEEIDSKNYSFKDGEHNLDISCTKEGWYSAIYTNDSVFNIISFNNRSLLGDKSDKLSILATTSESIQEQKKLANIMFGDKL